MKSAIVIGASAALIRNKRGEIAIVKPTYRDEWLLPGGAIEAGETPKECCKRECLEELNIAINLGALLCVEYRKVTRDFRFVFDGGVLSSETSIQLPKKELESYRFVSISEAMKLVDAKTANRLVFIQAGAGVYLET